MNHPRTLLMLARVHGLEDWPHTFMPYFMLAEIIRYRRRGAAVLREYRRTPREERSAELCFEATVVLRHLETVRREERRELRKLERRARPGSKPVLGTPPDNEDADWSVIFGYLTRGGRQTVSTAPIDSNSDIRSG